MSQIDSKAMEERRFSQTQRPDDVRSEFDRDESRLIHSAAFRRLQSKTQVLGLGESDFYRTRLTHSMEVAQIGRGILQYLKKKGDPNKVDFLPDEALITAICLAHDIGHPPFGHGGEVALNYCMREHGGFEGNGQTLRILGKLDKYTDEYGLNPTRRMLLGVLKYPASYNDLVETNGYGEPSDPYWLFKADTQKPPKCYHQSDQDIVDFIFEGFERNDIDKFTKYDVAGANKHRKTKYKSLDCSIMNLADNISYSLHDLEDALSLGMITRDVWDKWFDGKTQLFDGLLNYEDITEGLFGAGHIRKEKIGSLVNLMITNTEIIENGSHCDHPLLANKVQLTFKVERLRERIFDLVFEKVILNTNVQQLEFKGQKVIVELFRILNSDPERFLPEATLEKWEKAPEGDRVRVVCDFISGMTDGYATKYYEKLIIPTKGSIFDKL